MTLPTLTPDAIRNKRVLIRIDLDVPLSEDGVITDDSRLVASLPTLEFLITNNAQIRIIGHLGRPVGNDPKYSLKPVAQWLVRNLKLKVQSSKMQFEQLNGFWGWEISENVFLLENIRFFEEEEKNDAAFAKKLAYLADIYVNDAFAVSHRSHASLVGVAKLLPHYAGLHLQKEVEVLSGILENPTRPLAVIIGGAKIETKLPLVEKMHQLADYVLVGGKIADETRTLLQVQHEKVENRKSALLVAALTPDKLDITQKDAENFVQIIQLAKTVVWNGPVGKTEDKNSVQGSKIIAQGVVDSGAYSVVGGGDTLGFLDQIGLLDKFSFVSTGGGAMLSFLSGETLPGIEVLSS